MYDNSPTIVKTRLIIKYDWADSSWLLENIESGFNSNIINCDTAGNSPPRPCPDVIADV